MADVATISFAGIIAERKAGYRSSGLAEAGDQECARETLGHHADVLEPVFTRRATAIVDDQWGYIRALATVLQRRRRLEEDDLNGLMNEWRLRPPDRVTLAGANDKTRLLLCSLIYPEDPNQISPEWVQRTTQGLCPDLTAAETVDLLRHITDGLKNTHCDWAYLRARDKIITDITLIQNLSIAAELLAKTLLPEWRSRSPRAALPSHPIGIQKC